MVQLKSMVDMKFMVVLELASTIPNIKTQIVIIPTDVMVAQLWMVGIIFIMEWKKNQKNLSNG